MTWMDLQRHSMEVVMGKSSGGDRTVTKHIRTPYLVNATFLRRYRFVPDQPAARMQLIYTLQALGDTTPQGLLAATFLTSETRMAGLTALWSLIATKRVWADLSQPLTMASRIRFMDI